MFFLRQKIRIQTHRFIYIYIYIITLNTKGRIEFYPAFWKKLFSSSHLFIGKHPCEKPNITLEFKTNGVQVCLFSLVSYMTLSCKVPPNLIFKGENAAQHSKANDNLIHSQNIVNCPHKKKQVIKFLLTSYCI